MKKKIIGSVLRTIAAAIAGYLMADLEPETLKKYLEIAEQFIAVNKEVIGVGALVVAQGHSLYEKKSKNDAIKSKDERINSLEKEVVNMGTLKGLRNEDFNS